MLLPLTAHTYLSSNPGLKPGFFYSTHYYGLSIERVYGKRLNREQTSRLFHFKSGFKSGFFSFFWGVEGRDRGEEKKPWPTLLG